MNTENNLTPYAAILAGTKTVELRSYLPAKLHPRLANYLLYLTTHKTHENTQTSTIR